MRKGDRTLKRGRLEIYLTLLQAVRQEHKPTKLMYTTNLSWIPLAAHLRHLQDSGLLRVEEAGRYKRYYLTAKGRDVVDYFVKLKAAVPLPHLTEEPLGV